MKKLFLVILILNSICLFSQKYFKIDYEMTFVDLNLNKNEKNKKKLDSVYQKIGGENANELKELTEKILDKIKNNKAFFDLTNNDNISSFKNIPKLGENTFDNILSNAMADNLNYFQVFKEKNIIKISIYKDKEFKISSKIVNNWKPTAEKKQILGYTCTKAIDEKKPESFVWFTDEIKTPTGPAEYGGLNGLILEVQDNGLHYLATKIEKLEKEPTIKFPKKGKIITQEEFEKIKKESENN